MALSLITVKIIITISGIELPLSLKETFKSILFIFPHIPTIITVMNFAWLIYIKFDKNEKYLSSKTISVESQY